MSDPRLQRRQADGPQSVAAGRIDKESQPRDPVLTYGDNRSPFRQAELRTGGPAVTPTTDPAAGRSPAEAVQRAVNALANGRMVVVTGDAERDHQGDLLVAAEAVTAQQMAFIVRHSTGIVCAAMKTDRCQALRLPHLRADHTPEDGAAFTVSADHVAAGTGVSAAARTRTVQALAAYTSAWDNLRRPGHIFPLRARDGGVLARAGRAEAAVDLTVMAGLSGVGVIGEVVGDDGSMLAGGYLAEFAVEHHLPMLAIADLVQVRRTQERIVERVASASMPTASGVFRALAYRNALDATEHLALVLGDVAAAGRRGRGVLVRLHNECLTGDILGSLGCDCGADLEKALRSIADEGCGAVVYLRGREGRGMDLAHNDAVNVLREQERAACDPETAKGQQLSADGYGVGAQILADLGIGRVLWITPGNEEHNDLAALGHRPLDRCGAPPGADTAHACLTREPQALRARRHSVAFP